MNESVEFLIERYYKLANHFYWAAEDDVKLVSSALRALLRLCARLAFQASGLGGLPRRKSVPNCPILNEVSGLRNDLLKGYDLSLIAA